MDTLHRPALLNNIGLVHQAQVNREVVGCKALGINRVAACATFERLCCLGAFKSRMHSGSIVCLPTMALHAGPTSSGISVLLPSTVGQRMCQPQAATAYARQWAGSLTSSSSCCRRACPGPSQQQQRIKLIQ